MKSVFLGIFIAFILILFGEIYLASVKKRAKLDPVLTLVSSERPVTKIDAKTDTMSLEKVVQKAMLKTNGTYGIAIYNLKTKETYYSNEHKGFETASLYKLWLMVEVYDRLSMGNISKADVMKQSINVLNEKFGTYYSSQSTQDGMAVMTVEDALEKMITLSDNYAALLLSEKVDLNNVSEYIKNKGLTESRLGIIGGAPLTTASDILLFLKKLYEGELADATYTNEMLALLKNQKINNKLPKFLPKDTIIAHKTGELGLNSHDAGIVYGPEGDYIIVILTTSDNPQTENINIANISKVVYDYFSFAT